MLAFKKLYGDELLRLALVLSLLKANPDDYLENETQQLITGLHISNGSDWSLEQEAQTLIRPRFVHPKSLDNILMNYERQLFEELNSLGRYNSHSVNNDRIWNNRGPVLHTYLVNNVATDTVVPGLPAAADLDESPDHDGVSADDNVAQEFKVTDEVEEVNATQTETEEEKHQPDAVVTLSADFLHNRTESDVFAEIASRSFDVNEFLVSNEMRLKKELDEDEPENLMDVRVKIEREHDDLYSDNAIDDFVPYFSEKAEKLGYGENSVFHQNLADLQDYKELFEVNELQNDLEFLDMKQQQENLEQYLLENTPLDPEVYELAPMFEEELVLDMKRERASTSFTSASSSGVSEMNCSSIADVSDLKVEPDVKLEPDEGHHSGDELTQEDMDLIEVLWKQDVDMGFCLEDPINLEGPQATKVDQKESGKDLKTAEEKKIEDENIEKVKASLLDTETKEDDIWAGLSYTVDTETGECVIQESLVGSESRERFDLLEEALQLVELGPDDDNKDEQPQAVEGSSAGEMLHPAMRHVPHHPLAHYHNQSLMRSMSVEQRWQDLASLLTIPPPPDQYQHYQHAHPHPHPHPHAHAHPHPHAAHPHPHAHNIGAHGAAAGYPANYHAPAPAPPAPPEKHPDAYGAAGAAVGLEGAYKVESAHHPHQHDAIYYQNSSSEMPPNQDVFLQSILNDEDLQVMDMALNEGMYTMRMLDGAPPHLPHNHSHMAMTQERDSASDSAVSSMGSERVPSLSDGEWCDGSDSAQEFHSSKFRPYDAAYGRDRAAPQKKHHMFGKRCFQEQPAPLEPLARPGVVKYECDQNSATTYHHDNMHMHNVDMSGRQLGPPFPALDMHPHPALPAHTSHALLQSGVSAGPRLGFGGGPGGASGAAAGAGERVRHNHTYSAPLPPAEPRTPTRDKRVRRLTEGSVSDGGSLCGHLTRDEKRAKALGIPLEVHDIINLPMDEFNERLSKHDLSEAQLSLIRDIRRRGKNKVAAQNCRKRKLDQITVLADEVRSVRDRKQRAARDRHALLAERARLKERFAQLYRHVFQNLRDGEGRPLSSSQFSLQQAADGSVVLVPKMPHADHSMNRTDDDMDRKTKHYDQ